MLSLSVLERLQKTNSDAEIWWDSLPSDYPSWRDGLLASAPNPRVWEKWSNELGRFLNTEDPASSFIRGVTTNPSLIAKSIVNSPAAWTPEIYRLVRHQSFADVESTYWLLYQEVVRRAANTMLPMWEKTQGRYGWVSGQLDPQLVFDSDRMLAQGLLLGQTAPNVMVKVPGSRQGYEVVRRLVAHGVSINGTLSYTVPQFMECINAIEAGLAEARRRGVDTTRWRAVITHMIGRFGANQDRKSVV